MTPRRPGSLPTPLAGRSTCRRGRCSSPASCASAPDDHVVVVRVHHTVFDDWSVDVFRRELSALYGARVAGATSPLAEPATSYAAFSRRQQAALAGSRGDDQRAWWRKELAGAPLATQLPAGEDTRPQAALRVDLPPALAAGVRALAPRLRATPYMTVLSAFSALLARITGQDDLVIATVVAHRDRTDVEPLIGCFTKKVPLRLRVEGRPDVRRAGGPHPGFAPGRPGPPGPGLRRGGARGARRRSRVPRRRPPGGGRVPSRGPADGEAGAARPGGRALRRRRRRPPGAPFQLGRRPSGRRPGVGRRDVLGDLPHPVVAGDVGRDGSDRPGGLRPTLDRAAPR